LPRWPPELFDSKDRRSSAEDCNLEEELEEELADNEAEAKETNVRRVAVMVLEGGFSPGGRMSN
jgi:hypothetical protein